MLHHVILKEFIQFRRDRRMIPIVFVAPIVQLIVLGYAASLDVVDLKLAVCDADGSTASRDLVRDMSSAGYFVKTVGMRTCTNDARLFETSQASLALHIPRGFEEELDSGRDTEVLLTIDGTDTIPAGQGVANTQLALEKFNRGRLAASGMAGRGIVMAGVQLQDRVWFNPELKSKDFFVPGILGMLLLLMTMILTSMAMVKEKERGSIESIIVSPLRPMVLVAGKLVPFVLVGLLDVLLVVVAARLVFDIPFHGSLLTLFTVSLLFIFNTTGLGLLISTLSNTQQEAMMSAMFFVMMPIMYLSGFVFPVESMPEPVQPFTNIVPLTHFLVAIRGIFLKGSTLVDLWPQCAWLAATGSSIFILSGLRFRKKLS
jgi:ABC-2 type transport system permease protein